MSSPAIVHGSAHGNLRMKRHTPIDTSAKTILDDRSSLLESTSRTTSKIDYITRIGLGSDTSKQSYYRKVMTDPHYAVSQQYLRQYTAEVLDNILEILFTDAQVWNRVKTILLRRHPGRISSLREEVSDEGLRALLRKSSDHEIPLDTVFEVYSRGASEGGEASGFSRLNSFIAGGRARKLDADLVVESVITPQPKTDRTLSIVKRILAEKKERN